MADDTGAEAVPAVVASSSDDAAAAGGGGAAADADVVVGTVVADATPALVRFDDCDSEPIDVSGDGGVLKKIVKAGDGDKTADAGEQVRTSSNRV